VPTNPHAARLLSLAVNADRRAKDWKHRAVAFVSEAHVLGASWTDVGDAFGITRQAAYERFHGVNRPGRPRRPRTGDAGRLSAPGDRHSAGAVRQTALDADQRPEDSAP